MKRKQKPHNADPLSLQREDLLLDVDGCLVRVLSDLSIAHTIALDAEDFMLADGIHHAMTMLEAALGFVPAPQPTHRATEAMQ